jgi:periplasmic protein TonB
MVEQATLDPAMFADSLLETSWAHHSRRGWSTLTSFGAQVVAIGFLLLIPVLSSVSPPAARSVATPISLGRVDPGPAPQPHGARNPNVPMVPFSGRIIAPGRMPTRIPTGDDGSQTGADGAPGAPLGDYIGSGRIGLPVPFSGYRPVMPTVATTTVRPFRTSSMLQGSLIHRVDPQYPPMARAARIQGSVVLAAVIGKDGTMNNLRLISGHPLLVQAAIAAVSQWRYKPYILNDEAIEVETQITVNFVLGGN